MLCSRRTARRKAKPSAAAQLPALARRQRRPRLRLGLHLVQGGGIEAGAKTLIELGGSERPQALRS